MDGSETPKRNHDRAWHDAQSLPRWLIAAALAGLFYLVWNTGLHSDDYPILGRVESFTFLEYLLPNPQDINVLVFGPVSYYFDYFPFFAFGYGFLPGYDLVKCLSAALAAWLTYRFAADYLSPDRAFLAAMAFVLYPIHDATLYWHVTLVYTLTPAIIMFAHHLVRHDRPVAGSIVGITGAFCSYASPPYTFGLAVIFLLEKAYRKALLAVAPGVAYVAYYLAVSGIPGLSKGRIEAGLNPATFLKQFALQAATFLDASLGPSFWLKLWFSIASIAWPTALIVLAASGALFLWYRPAAQRFPGKLVAGMACATVLSFAMFALTGLYPQMAFNLGNRVTVYGSLLLAFLLASVLRGRPLVLVVAVLLAAVGGLSDHWKAWNQTQLQLISDIRANPDLKQIASGERLFVVGHAYSHLGPFSHIEFFSETYVSGAVFQRAAGGPLAYSVESVGVNHLVRDGYLIDRKYGDRQKLPERVLVYDIERNRLDAMPPRAFEDLLKARPPEVRHWLQMLGDGWLRSTLLVLMPRLKYLFGDS